MKVVQSFQSTYWTRVGWAADGEQTNESVLTKYPLRKVLLAASVTSWMRLAPECERVLYVDRENFDIIKAWGYDILWNKVEIINFQEKLGNLRYYTATKPYTWTLQTEPYWSCDLDCFLTDYLPKYFEKWCGQLYVSEPISSKDLSSFYSRDSYIRSTAAKFYRRQDCVNTGMLFCPNPAIGRILGLALLELDRQLELGGRQWTSTTRIYYQEAAYCNLLRDLGIEIQNIEDGSFYYHKPDNLKDKETVDRSTIENIQSLLGYDPIEVADSVSKELKILEKSKKKLL